MSQSPSKPRPRASFFQKACQVVASLVMVGTFIWMMVAAVFLDDAPQAMAAAACFILGLALFFLSEEAPTSKAVNEDQAE